MKRLLRSLEGFGSSSAPRLPVELLKELAVKDLGFYVSDVHVDAYLKRENYPIQKYVFSLQKVLHPGATARLDRIGCSTLFDSDQVTCCWFILPPRSVLPLHDHPGMMVWQRVLHGSLQLSSIKWSPDDEVGAAPPGARGGRVVSNGVVAGRDGPIGAGDLLSIVPDGSGGTLHELRNRSADTPALFIDIISPPYFKPPTYTPCVYYTAIPRSDVAAVDAPPDCGVRHDFTAGDGVWLLPRHDYGGPPMTGYASVE